jgi:hypothetical protein
MFGAAWYFYCMKGRHGTAFGNNAAMITAAVQLYCQLRQYHMWPVVQGVANLLRDAQILAELIRKSDATPILLLEGVSGSVTLGHTCVVITQLVRRTALASLYILHASSKIDVKRLTAVRNVPADNVGR